MAQQTPPSDTPKSGQSREDRLKAALKANLGRRKAQARARSSGATEDNDSAEAGKSGKVKG